MVSKVRYGVLAVGMILAMLLVACAAQPGGAVATTVATQAPIATTAAAPTVAAPTVAATSQAAAGITSTATVSSTLPEAGVTVTSAAPAGGTAAAIDCMGAKPGDQISAMYQWSGAEEDSFNKVMKPFLDACGIKLVGQSTRDAAVLDAKVKSQPPDVVFWPSAAPLNLYAAQLKDLGSLGATASNYADFWVKAGTVNGKWLGIGVKVDIKTIVWYSPANFKLFNYQVPKTWDELNALVEQMVKDGNVPWSMGFESGAATGWTGADFIQDILLVQQGPDYVNKLLTGAMPYNDAGVKKAYETYGKWASDPKYTVGGASGTVSTAFLEAIYKVYSNPPQAMMVRQSGFAGGEIAKQFPNLKYGTDYDFFQLPEAKGLQGGGDTMMAFNDTPAVRALVGYITGPAGGAQWASIGFDMSPNKNAAGHYPDPLLEKKAKILADASALTPSLGDTIPAPFQNAQWKSIVDYVNGADLDQALTQAAAAQADALKK